MKELLLLSCWILVLVSGSEDPQQVIVRTVEGENVILPCKAPNNNQNILVVKWTRLDLEEDQFVFFYRDDHFDPDNHPSFKNRVNLSEELMKNGDVSLILNNVTFNDRGTFECLVCQTGSENRRKRSLNTDYLTTIVLSVDRPGEPEEERGGGGRVGLTVAALIVVVVFGAVVFQTLKKKKSDLPPPGSGSPPRKAATLSWWGGLCAQRSKVRVNNPIQSQTKSSLTESTTINLVIKAEDGIGSNRIELMQVKNQEGVNMAKQENF